MGTHLGVHFDAHHVRHAGLNKGVAYLAAITGTHEHKLQLKAPRPQQVLQLIDLHYLQPQTAVLEAQARGDSVAREVQCFAAERQRRTQRIGGGKVEMDVHVAVHLPEHLDQ
jgi:hypothetical protein